MLEVIEHRIPFKNKSNNFVELMELFKYREIPSNFIINKFRTGIGATTAEIIAKRHSIIIAPYVEILNVKKSIHNDNIVILRDKISNLDVIQYISNNAIQYKKIFVVPEGFNRLIKILKEIVPNLYTEYFLLFDECEKLIEDLLFRTRITSPMEDFFAFKNKAMISATPLIPSDPRFKEAGFKIMELKPDWDFRKKIKLITTDNINTSLRNHIQLIRDKQPIFLFTNCKKTMLYLIKHCNTDDFKIFCSEELKTSFFLNADIPKDKIECTVSEQNFAQINVFTSRFFSGIDMFLNTSIQPHIIIVTNLPRIRHSMINPKTTALQIIGRCRNGVKSVTHITTLDTISKVIPEDKIIEEVNHWTWYFQKLVEVKGVLKHETISDTIGSLLDIEFSSLLIQEGKIDSYFRDALINKLQVKNYYSSPRTLLEAYLKTENFIVEHCNVQHPKNPLDKLSGAKEASKKHNQYLAETLESYDILLNEGLPLTEEEADLVHRIASKHTILFELYCTYGLGFFEDIDYSKAAMVREFVAQKLALNNNQYTNMLDEILTTFIPYTRYLSEDIKTMLQEIYDKHEFKLDLKTSYTAKASDIQMYFDVKYNDGKFKHPKRGYKTSYMIGLPKYKLSNDLKPVYHNNSSLPW